MMRVVITDSGYQSYELERSILAEVGAELEIRHCVTEEDVITLAADADGVIVRQQPITSNVIRALRRCRIIARYGVGTDNVDIDEATRRGIIVANVRNYCNDEVAEHAIALLFDCARRLTRHDRLIRSGEWDIGQRDPIYRISGKTLGLVGYGMIGRTMREKLAGLRLDVLVYDPFVTPGQLDKDGCKAADLETLLRNSDFVSIHAPATPETHHLINSRTLGLMKPTAILINTSRGSLIDTSALANALKTGQIAAAGIDAHEVEPPPPDYALFSSDRVVISDHKGWYSEESTAVLQGGAARAVAAVLSGGLPEYLVNPEVGAVLSPPARYSEKHAVP